MAKGKRAGKYKRKSVRPIRIGKAKQLVCGECFHKVEVNDFITIRRPGENTPSECRYTCPRCKKRVYASLPKT